MCIILSYLSVSVVRISNVREVVCTINFVILWVNSEVFNVALPLILLASDSKVMHL